MRVYVGELVEDGQYRVWVAQEEERIDLAELVEVTAQLRALSRPLPVEGLNRAEVMARKEAIVAHIDAVASLPPPVELVCPGVHSQDGFAWGSADTGAADLAHSILRAELGAVPGADVCFRFRDEVIARLPDRTHFRLSADDVWEWISANRDLVERAFLERPRQAVVADTSVPDVDAATPNVDPEHADGATASAVVSACEAAWADIRGHHREVPEAVIILGSGVERGRLVKLGHWWGGRWLADGQVRGEVLLAGEALHLPAEQVFEVLLHEAAHGINAARGIKDTSRGGRYHNQRFAETAREVLLRVRATSPYGLAGTTLTDQSRERYAGTIERLDDEIRIARQLDRGLRPGAGGRGADGGSGDGREVDQGDGRSRGALAASCGCGRKMRMAPSVLARGPVLCGLCGSEFSTGAEVERAAGDVAVDRRRPSRNGAAADGDRPPPDLRDVIGRRREALGFALASAPQPDHQALAPLQERYSRLGVILDRLGGAPEAGTDRGNVSAAHVSPDQATAIAALVGESAADARLARWYEDLGTLRAEPMTAVDVTDAERLTRLARALLQADGTLRGATVDVGGREFQAGDPVVVTAKVPGGPTVGASGTVTEADPALGAIRIDFRSWGHVRAPLLSALAGSIAHDYAAVAEPELDAAPDPVVDLKVDRSSVGAEL